MNTNKEIKNVRKRNFELSKEVEELKYALYSLTNMSKELSEEELTKDLESMKKELENVLKNLHQYESEYSFLISELKGMVKVMRELGVGLPWYRRLFFKMKNIFIHDN